MLEFSAAELDRLRALRTQYQAGMPAVDQPAANLASPPESALRRLARAAGITLAVIPLGVGQHGVTRYFCRLSRQTPTLIPPLDVQFQVMATYPAAPELEEILAWVGGAIANHLTNGDIASWGLVFGITSAGRTHDTPYRGLVQAASDLAGFHQDQERLTAMTAAFLGPDHFRALLYEAGCEPDWLPSVAD